MPKTKFGLAKANYILMIAALFVIIAGFLMMTGEPSGEVFNPDIFSTRRITVAPMIVLAGFIGMVAAIMYKPKKRDIEG